MSVSSCATYDKPQPIPRRNTEPTFSSAVLRQNNFIVTSVTIALYTDVEKTSSSNESDLRVFGAVVLVHPIRQQ